MGPQVQPSFYKNPKATNEIVDTYGYLKTGDLFEQICLVTSFKWSCNW